jgi:nitric oxide reductase subunit C
VALANRNAFFLFLAGTLISAVIFLGMTWDTHRQFDALTNADQLSDQVVEGKKVWQKYECNLCHTILGFGGYYAPDLTKVHRRIGAAGIAAAVLRPEEVFADSYRHMPNLGVEEAEAEQLVAFFDWVGNIDNNDWPPQDSEERRSEADRLQGAGLSRGAAAFGEYCMGCHSLGGEGGGIGPALDDIASKYDATQIAEYIREPTAVNPQSAMPPQTQTSEDDRRAIGEFLTQQQ